MATQNKPVAEFKLGFVKAVVWKNETSAGARLNTTFARIYRKDDEWHETASFGRDDLPLLEKVASQAHTFIFESSATKPRSAKEATETAGGSE